MSTIDPAIMIVESTIDEVNEILVIIKGLNTLPVVSGIEYAMSTTADERSVPDRISSMAANITTAGAINRNKPIEKKQNIEIRSYLSAMIVK